MNRFIFLFLLICVASLLSAQPYVYWCEAGREKNSIMRADINNPTDVTVFLPNTTANFLAVNSTHLFWTWTDVNKAGGYIGRVKLDGTELEPMFISGCSNPGGIAVNATQIFWMDYVEKSTNTIPRSWKEIRQAIQVTSDAPIGYFRISRAAIDGTNVEYDFITNEYLELFGPVAVNSTYLFYSGYIKSRSTSVQQTTQNNTLQSLDPNQKTDNARDPFIYRYQLAEPHNVDTFDTDGVPIESLAATETLLFGAFHQISVIFWGKIDNEEFGGTIEECNTPSGLAVNSTHVFWTNLGQDPQLPYGISIGRASIAGDTVSEIEPEFIADCIEPYSPACTSGSQQNKDPFNCGAVGLEFVFVFFGLALLRKLLR